MDAVTTTKCMKSINNSLISLSLVEYASTVSLNILLQFSDCPVLSRVDEKVDLGCWRYKFPCVDYVPLTCRREERRFLDKSSATGIYYASNI